MKPATLIQVMLLCLVLASPLVIAEPEPTLTAQVRGWLKGFTANEELSIGSSYQSFVRWNPNLRQCWYYTGIHDMISARVVEDRYCSSRDYVIEYKTISSVDLQIAGARSTTEPQYKSIGEACTSVVECGAACKGYPSSYSPRCIDGGQGKVCFCGANDGVYSSVCARNTDCEAGELCVHGVCTLSQASQSASGNPPTSTGAISREEICKVIDCNKRCADGTPTGTCVPGKEPRYCDPEGRLIDYSGVCGCPEGQRLDFGGLTCCTPPNCASCEAGEEKVKQCPDGSEVVAVTCTAGTWTPTGALCPIDEPVSLGWLVAAIVVLILLAIGAAVYAFSR